MIGEGRGRQPPDRRAAARPGGGPLRLQPRPQDRQAGDQRLEVHDPEGDRRPLRGGRQGGRRRVPRGAAPGRAVRRAARQGHHGARRGSRSSSCSTSTATSSRTWPAGWRGRWGSGPAPTSRSTPRRWSGSALFDAAHGTAPDIAGKGLANPTAIFLALSLLLYQIGEIRVGKAVKDAHARPAPRGTCGPGTSAARSRPRASPPPSPPRSPAGSPRARTRWFKGIDPGTLSPGDRGGRGLRYSATPALRMTSVRADRGCGVPQTPATPDDPDPIHHRKIMKLAILK